MTIALAALASFASAASAAQADAVMNLLNRLKAEPGASVVTPAQVLPAISNPRPYRQGVMATCNSKIMNLGNNYGCILIFDQVPSGHLLQADKISCGIPGAAAILFNTQIKVDGTHFLGFAMGASNAGTAAETSGPFYFKAGETPKLVGTGSSSTDTAICTMFGTLWRTN